MIFLSLKTISEIFSGVFGETDYDYKIISGKTQLKISLDLDMGLLDYPLCVFSYVKIHFEYNYALCFLRARKRYVYLKYI